MKYNLGECILCKKELPKHWMICFNCSINRKEEVFKVLDQLARDMAFLRNEM